MLPISACGITGNNAPSGGRWLIVPSSLRPVTFHRLAPCCLLFHTLTPKDLREGNHIVSLILFVVVREITYSGLGFDIYIGLCMQTKIGNRPDRTTRWCILVLLSNTKLTRRLSIPVQILRPLPKWCKGVLVLEFCASRLLTGKAAIITAPL